MNLKPAIFGLIILGAFLPLVSHAQETEILAPDIVVEKAKVLEVSNEQIVVVPGTETLSHTQMLKAEVIDGVDKGKVVTFENDYTQLHTGDEFYIRHVTNRIGERDYWTVADAYRIPVLVILSIVFVILLFIFGGTQGIRGLMSLLGSLVLIFYVLLPGILHGYSPILVSIGVSSLIIVVGSYITHGFNKTTTAAVLGMITTVIVIGLAAYWAVHAGNLSGYTNEENVYLNFSTRGGLNMVDLLFGGIMIGLLGVLYDIAIGQAIAVEELFSAGRHLTRLEIYKRAIRIGREHIGALVNTLAIAYVGVALPLLLLMINTPDLSAGALINGEMFATEIVRILIGSIGLILGVPITTLIASYMLSEKDAAGQGPSEHHHHH